MKKAALIFQIAIISGLLTASDTTRIVILHTNDMHAKIDNMAKIAHKIDSIRLLYNNVYLFSAGDIFTGNPIVDRYKIPCYPIIDLMNDLGYDISCLGNHEFDHGQNVLNDRIEQAKFPVICANIDTKDAVLKPLNPFVKFTTKEGIEIGVLGFLQVESTGLPATNPLHLNGLVFSDVTKKYRKYKKYKDSADILLALTHLGVESDKKIAKKLKFIDVVVGGHSHTKLEKGIKQRKTLIVQAGSKNKYLGVLTLIYANGQIVSATDSLIPILENSTENKKIRQKIDDYNNNPYFDETIGQAVNSISGYDELGALITDAILDTLDVDIVFQNAGGIRIDKIPQGYITRKQILELSPFGNTFIVFKLTATQIKKMVKYAYYLENVNEVQPSGIMFEIKLNSAKKIKSVVLKDYNENVIPDDKIFRVAINNYMALAWELDFLKNGKQTGIVDAEAIMNYVHKKEKIDYTGVVRVFVMK